MRQKNIIIILFAMLAFLSQASASVEIVSPIQHVAMQNMSSSAMSNSDMSCQKDSLVAPDCCKNAHNCSMVSCLATLSMVKHQVLLPERIITHNSPSLVIHELPQHNVSLYRPPILV
ncbi:hypothetical protein V6259_06440 [Marinomonas sp. TI.3.20]|uniref:hypothetical protein n=1 Tax=Marinomonas sp. TI.3.20 TaxID=3121296 RepID=UPI00311FD164